MFGMLALSVFAGTDVLMSDYFDVYFKFRAPHHFMPSYFITWEAVVFFMMLIWAIWNSYKSHFLISSILSIIGVGALVYVVSVQFFDSQFIASTQWFKTMQWAKLFIGLSLIAMLDPMLRKIQFKMPSAFILSASIISLVGIVILFKFPQLHPLKKQNGLVQKASNNALFSFVKENVHQNASFIIPIDNTDFKFGAERSVYVDYKSINPKPAFVQVWKERIENVYGSFSEDAVGFKFYSPATNHYNSLTDQDFAYLMSKGVSHALFDNQKINKNLRLVYQDENNFVYALDY